jgi:hypothetical protein
VPKASKAATAQTERPRLAAANFPPDAAASVTRDWYRFVLVELNGLGTMLRFDAEQGGAKAADIGRRARAILDTFGWDPATSAEQAWAFIESELHEPHDAWGPYLVLSTLGREPERVQAWARDLRLETRDLLAGTKRI